MGSSFGRILRTTTFGESHSVALGCVIENVPAGLKLSEKDIQVELDRRRPGQSNITTPRKESDKVEILSGLFEGKTIGSPISMIVYNQNAKSKDYSHFKNIFRPSHADYTYHARYGHRSYLGGSRASARATIGLVAAGSIAKKILSEKTKIQICAFVSSIYNLSIDVESLFSNPPNLKTFSKKVESNSVRCPDTNIAKKMTQLIQNTRQEGDSLGGIISTIATGIPAGLGDPVFDRLDALITYIMMAIPATKAVEIGSGFSSTLLKGSQHNDPFYIDSNNKIRTKTNYSGGIQGGISNGEPITMRIAFKPTSTINQVQHTVNENKKECTLQVKGRHDPCVLPRAVPIVEAALALVLADQYLLSQTSQLNHI